MPAAAVGAVAAIGGSLISSRATKKAGKTAANATREASAQLIAQTDRARTEILDRMVPALKDYGNEMDNLQQAVADGTVDVLNILQTSTGNAMQVLSDAGANARQALLGSAASASGTPRAEFSQQYSQIMQLPPAQQEQAFQQSMPQAYNTFRATQIGSDTGDRSTGAYSRTVGEEGVPMSEAQWQATQPNERFRLPNMDRGSSEAYEGSTLQKYISHNQGETYEGYLAKVANANANRPVEEGHKYTGYQDRGTPGIDVNMQRDPSGTYVANRPAAPGTGFYGADQQLVTGENRALAQLAGGTGQARQDIQFGRTQALDRLQPYSSTGRDAQQMEAALSGALGPEAQQEAINNYIESPGQQYLRERQESSLLRNASAIGGLGGGRVRTALQEQAFGIASTQQQQHLENLRNLATRGQSADTTAAGIEQTAATQMAQLAEALGVRGADIVSMSSQQRAALAERAGLSLAQLEQVIGAAQAGQLAALGGQQSAAVSGGTADIVGLGERAAGTQATGQQNISQILANLATQQGTNLANLTVQGGSALAASQAQAGATMGQGFQDAGNIAAYALANRAQVPPPVTPPVTGLPGSNPQTDYYGMGMTR